MAVLDSNDTSDKVTTDKKQVDPAPIEEPTLSDKSEKENEVSAKEQLEQEVPSKKIDSSIPRTKLKPHEIINEFESCQKKSKLPEIYVGDTVRVGVKISEGNKQRVQPYEGVVISKRHGGLNETITVRRIFQGIGVERVFMLHSPQVDSIKVERRGKVRKAKLFYLRDRVGKATRVKQRFDR